MYLKKLDLVGFKSFMNKTTLEFEPGITTVVGPNGTGKSNIFDSIRWVLGEQSVKALRGSQMEDVIFNGTDSKEPLSMAEVTLTFDNSQRFFSLDHEDVAVTRRLFRSGESEYLLNKTQVRLKDILDLLSGTGIGSEGYSLVEQGKIDLILSSRPEDRRLVFDEASGITRYKTQKKETMRRLEETEQNLLRVGDIIAEVKRQIGSLERQANKARRYKEVFVELKAKEINLALIQKRKLQNQKSEIIGQLNQLKEKENNLLEAIKAQESRIQGSQQELRSLQEGIMNSKNQLLNLDNLIIRNKEHIKLNHERILELENTKKHLAMQMEQTKNKIIFDEEKLNNLKDEYGSIEKNIAIKSSLLRDKEAQLNNINLSVKTAQENIARSKKNIMEVVTKSAQVRNEISDIEAKQQIHLARKKRLGIEKAKINEEKAVLEDNLKNIVQELERLETCHGQMKLKIASTKDEQEKENLALSQMRQDIEESERRRLVLESQKEFLEKLKTRYEDISESMNAVIYLDKLPKESVSGLVVKIKEQFSAESKLSGEAKPIDLDTRRVNEQISQIVEKVDKLKSAQSARERRIEELNKNIALLEEERRNQEAVLINKRAAQQSLTQQCQKLKEEEEVILVELSDVEKEVSSLVKELTCFSLKSLQLDNQKKEAEDLIITEQNNINLNINLREETLVTITQAKTELDALTRRIGSDQAGLKILEDTYRQDRENLLSLEKQTQDITLKQESLNLETKEFQDGINRAEIDLQNKDNQLKEAEDKCRVIIGSTGDIVKKIDADRKELDTLKDKLYELQMRHKDLDFKVLGIKERMLQSYKVELDSIKDMSAMQEIDENTFLDQIERQKEKLDSLGSVNLVAIEEYDELKVRYDFLNQQQNDLVQAKESLHEAILKVNRTTRKMFLETFEKIKQEFRNYFRLLFNGGDAQVFLIDEQDPLESGIEIICRPVGKKLQNVLLLSGGEKALSAIALLFAIFKVKPAPFCILDEIDAALDEANVDRFGRLLQEFISTSQFIVITHNKRTIANADVMYGITMAESGVSKIVSVKFKEKSRQKKESEPLAEAEAELA